jgi:uncharacterized protein YjiS (DUF1127 family)
MINRLVSSYRHWRNYHRTFDALTRLSPRQLEDLGINPVDIRSIARGGDVAFRGTRPR